MSRRPRYHKQDTYGEILKWCNHCKRWLPLYLFSKNKKSWDGLECMCRDCTSEKNSKFRESNPNYHKVYLEKRKDKNEEEEEENS